MLSVWCDACTRLLLPAPRPLCTLTGFNLLPIPCLQSPTCSPSLSRLARLTLCGCSATPWGRPPASALCSELLCAVAVAHALLCAVAVARALPCIERLLRWARPLASALGSQCSTVPRAGKLLPRVASRVCTPASWPSLFSSQLCRC